MTTIGSTAYYTTGSRVGPTENKNGRGEDAISSTGNKASGNESLAAGSGATSDSRQSDAAANLQGKLFALDASYKMGHETLKGTPLWELPNAEYQEHLARMERMAADLESQYTDRPWNATVEESLKWIPVSPATQPYATVTVAGKVVATIDNQGVVSTENDGVGRWLSQVLVNDVNGSNGPVLSHARADQIAKLLGGRVVTSDTALTQSQFHALPSILEPKGIADYEALRRDPLYNQLDALKDKRTEYLKQQQEAGSIGGSLAS